MDISIIGYLLETPKYQSQWLPSGGEATELPGVRLAACVAAAAQRGAARGGALALATADAGQTGDGDFWYLSWLIFLVDIWVDFPDLWCMVSKFLLIYA